MVDAREEEEEREREGGVEAEAKGRKDKGLPALLLLQVAS
jgi:hypothetical protein